MRKMLTAAFIHFNPMKSTQCLRSSGDRNSTDMGPLLGLPMLANTACYRYAAMGYSLIKITVCGLFVPPKRQDKLITRTTLNIGALSNNNGTIRRVGRWSLSNKPTCIWGWFFQQSIDFMYSRSASLLSGLFLGIVSCETIHSAIYTTDLKVFGVVQLCGV